MRAVLLLRHLQVENANAVGGLTWGFPAITHFTGFTHALSRKLEQAHGLRLGGCAVVCHQHQAHVVQPSGRGDYVFVQSRNPLTKEGSTAAIIEEGKMHLTVSLLIECEFSSNDLNFDDYDDAINRSALAQWMQQTVPTLRLAGGLIVAMHRKEPVFFDNLPDGEVARARFRRQVAKRLLPGFALVLRHDLLQAHWANMRERQANAELLDAWLDFSALYLDCPFDPAHDGRYHWTRRSKPAPGWLVPIPVGYRAISPLYQPGQVAGTRDASTPFRFVESVYSVGQWLSPHRIDDLTELLWHTRHEGDLYLCHNTYQPKPDTGADDEPGSATPA